MENLRVSICLILTTDPSAVRPVMSSIWGAVSVWGRREKRASSRTEEDLDEHEARGEMNIHCKPRDGVIRERSVASSVLNEVRCWLCILVQVPTSL